MTSQGALPVNAPEESLRVERNRFAAFAFCDADILLELDSGLNIVFAAGATDALIGNKPDELVGKDILELIARDQRQMVSEFLRLSAGKGRVEPILVRLGEQSAQTPPLVFTGLQVPDMDGHFFFALRMGLPPPPARATTAPVERDPESGLMDSDSFAEEAARQLSAPGGAEAGHQYSVFRLEGINDLRARLDEERRAELMNTIGSALRARSVYGDQAGRIDDERFGLIHDPKFDVDEMQTHLADKAREADPEKQGVVVHTASVKLDTEGMSEDDTVKAFVYTVNHLGEDGEDAPTITTLSEGLTHMVDDTAKEMASARSALESGDFEIHYQPVVDLETGTPLMYEVLSRFGGGKYARSPADFFRFTEEVGIAHDLDLVCCRRAIATLTSTQKQARLSVNLAAQSLADPGFVEKLFALLDTAKHVADRLYFDIKESAITADTVLIKQVIQELRRRRHKVCIDDFAAAASALHYLRSLEIDFVKIDSKYLRESLETKNGGFFLKAIAGLCGDLGIVVIASMVEDRATAVQIQQCGICYGQGYYWGRPAPKIEAHNPAA